ncbi:MAG: hypothetical protein F6J95_007700 [Leptolyngbya sp. SIO1E4]|nr:hypothetical protein [Leptolyngbya sp. SIO1E4]
MNFENCKHIHRWLTAVARNQPTQTDIDDCLDLLRKLDRSEKRDLWLWVSQHDSNLKQWLKVHGQQRRAA